MDDGFFVGGLQAFAALGGDEEKFFRGDGSGEAMAEGLTFNVLHDDPEFAGVLDDVIDGADVGVIE